MVEVRYLPDLRGRMEFYEDVFLTTELQHNNYGGKVESPTNIHIK